MKRTLTLKLVKSSALMAVGHSGTTLWVQFKASRKIYEYEGITKDQYLELIRADSVGKAFNEKIEIASMSFSDVSDSVNVMYVDEDDDIHDENRAFLNKVKIDSRYRACWF